MSPMTGNMPRSNSPDDVFTIGLNRAVTLLAEKKAKGRARRADPKR